MYIIPSDSSRSNSSSSTNTCAPILSYGLSTNMGDLPVGAHAPSYSPHFWQLDRLLPGPPTIYNYTFGVARGPHGERTHIPAPTPATPPSPRPLCISPTHHNAYVWPPAEMYHFLYNRKSAPDRQGAARW